MIPESPMPAVTLPSSPCPETCRKTGKCCRNMFDQVRTEATSAPVSQDKTHRIWPLVTLGIY